jgi:hypothetical protein
MVLPDERSLTGRVLRVAWTRRRDIPPGERPAVPSSERIERMYLTARHGAEFALPNASRPADGAARGLAWVVESSEPAQSLSWKSMSTRMADGASSKTTGG